MDAGGTSIPDQPPPQPNDGTPIWELVIKDMEERDQVGRQRYGTPLQTDNGRDMLIDAYQEALDLVVYLRGAIEERDARVDSQKRRERSSTGPPLQRERTT